MLTQSQMIKRITFLSLQSFACAADEDSFHQRLKKTLNVLTSHQVWAREAICEKDDDIKSRN